MQVADAVDEDAIGGNLQVLLNGLCHIVVPIYRPQNHKLGIGLGQSLQVDHSSLLGDPDLLVKAGIYGPEERLALLWHPDIANAGDMICSAHSVHGIHSVLNQEDYPLAGIGDLYRSSPVVCDLNDLVPIAVLS